MDYSLREWLILLGVILIVGVLVDGYRRVRSNKRSNLKVAIDKNIKFKDSDKIDFYNGELPGGGARLVRRPVDSKQEEAAELRPAAQQRSRPADEDEIEEIVPEPLFAEEEEDAVNLVTENVTSDVEALPEKTPEEPKTREKVKAQEKAKSAPAEDEMSAETDDTYRDVEEVIVISVFANDETGFENADIMRVILACGMRFGDMNIFHRNERDDGKGAIQFSMANAIKPGTFDLNSMEGVYTPGITFFLSLPGPEDSMKAFEYMLETAQCVAKNLNGVLKDEQHSDMRAQTIEHARQRVRDFERRQLSLLH